MLSIIINKIKIKYKNIFINFLYIQILKKFDIKKEKKYIINICVDYTNPIFNNNNSIILI